MIAIARQRNESVLTVCFSNSGDRRASCFGGTTFDMLVRSSLRKGAATIARAVTKSPAVRSREPDWLTAGRAKLGTREAAGTANNPTILLWAERLGTKVLGIIYNADSVPWCGVFVGVCLDEVHVASPMFAVQAKSWATWGVNLRAERLAPGAVLVFERPGGGHVGFYVGEDATAYHVLGGNQGDRVTVARIEKERCIARR